MMDLLLSGLGVFAGLVFLLGAVLLYQIGYLQGHAAGFREGVRRGSLFGRLKLQESKRP